MPRLIWVFAGHTLILLVWSCLGSFSCQWIIFNSFDLKLYWPAENVCVSIYDYSLVGIFGRENYKIQIKERISRIGLVILVIFFHKIQIQCLKKFVRIVKSVHCLMALQVNFKWSLLYLNEALACIDAYRLNFLSWSEKTCLWVLGKSFAYMCLYCFKCLFCLVWQWSQPVKSQRVWIYSCFNVVAQMIYPELAFQHFILLLIFPANNIVSSTFEISNWIMIHFMYSYAFVCKIIWISLCL